MSSIASLNRRALQLQTIITPRPRLIHCTEEADALLATLAAQIERDRDQGEQVDDQVSEQEYEEIAAQLSAWLTEDIARIEQEYNVRFVE